MPTPKRSCCRDHRNVYASENLTRAFQSKAAPCPSRSRQQRVWGLALSEDSDTNTAVAQVCDGCLHPADATPLRTWRCAANSHDAPSAPTQSSRRWTGDRWHWGASGSGHRLHRKARRYNRHKVGNESHPGCRRSRPPSGTNNNPPSLSIPWRPSKERTCDAIIHQL